MGDFLKFLQNNTTAVAVLVIIIMIIIPIPSVLLEIFLIFNLMFSLLILLIVLNSKKPIEIDIFPTLLLASTVFGLGINVSTTRAILTMGERLDVTMIHAFASFVVGGAQGSQGVVVGIIIFIIIIALQAIVITKGATRVSEVAARFSLDRMPVTLMAVDNEYTSGAITEEQARKKKEEIQKESSFYGAMDGASKFISGNVTLGIIITVINVIGGFIVGMIFQGGSAGAAFNTYIRFAIGDGLLAQIPSLLISTAMGVVVTRSVAVGSLTDQVKDQILSQGSHIYWMCAGVLSFLGIIGLVTSSFPWYILFPMSALFAFHAYRRGRTQKQEAYNAQVMQQTKDQKTEVMQDISPVVPLDALSLELGFGLVPLVEKEKGAELLDRVHGVRRQCAIDLGLVIPKVRIMDNSILEPSEYCFKIKGVEAGKGKIRIGSYLCINAGTAVSEIQGEKTVDPAFGLPAVWIDMDKRDEAERAGYTVVDPPSIIATHLTEIIRRRAADILGLQDTQAILDELRKDYPAVVDEVMRPDRDGRGMRITDIQKIFHGLLREKVSIRNKVSILEAIAEYAPVLKSTWFLTEKARQALASQICQQYADDDKRLRVLTIDPALEQKIIDSKYETASGMVCALDPPTREAWIKAVVKAVTKVKENGWMPVILCSEAARYLVKYSTNRELPDLAVLSVPEITEDIKPEAVGVISFMDAQGAQDEMQDELQDEMQESASLST